MSNILATEGRPAIVLLVEDNDNDVELTKLGFLRSRFAVNLQHVADGEACMAFLRKEGDYLNAPTPDLILLDLNMPRMNGAEVMDEIKNDENLKHIPVIVLTSSEAEKDIFASYNLHCNSYIVKPVGFENFAQAVKSITEYWFNLVILPKS